MKQGRALLALQTGTVAVLLGRSWQHFFWDPPYRVLIWDEQWMGPLVAMLGYPGWKAFATDLRVNEVLEVSTLILGGFLLAVALKGAFPGFWKKQNDLLLTGGAVLLFLLAFLYWKDHFFQLPMLMEFTLQWSMPLCFWLYFQERISRKTLIRGLSAAIALTFAGHGLYAVGWAPLPGHFLDMTMNILRVSEPVARSFLKTVGLLDFAVAALLFIPVKRIRKGAAMYMTLWGFATALARIGAYVARETLWSDLHQWGFEFLVRWPHFLGPLALLLLWKEQGSERQDLGHADEVLV